MVATFAKSVIRVRVTRLQRDILLLKTREQGLLMLVQLSMQQWSCQQMGLLG
jgi:hypothetical protein